MPVRNQQPLNRNASRCYPFDESASLLDDAGRRLPDDVLVGLKAAVPEVVGRYVYVGAMTVTTRLVSLIIMASTDRTVAGTPVLAFSLVKPFERYRSFDCESLYPGAAGWLAIGPGYDNQTGFSYRCSLPSQSLLAPRAASWYKLPPIPGVAKLNNPAMTGLVRLSGGANLSIVGECREVPAYPVASYDPQYCGSDELGTQVRRVIVFRLNDTSPEQNQNVFDLFKGPCGGRPDSYSCGEPEPIEFLGPVPPDCCGNITIEFRGCAEIAAVVETAELDDEGELVEVADACGFTIDCGLGLTDACVTQTRLPDSEGRLPNEYDDLCASVSYVSISEPPAPDVEFSFNPDDASLNGDPNLPFDDDFETLGDYVVRSGEFNYKDTGSDVLLAATSSAMRNVVTYEPTPAIAGGFYRRVQARVSLRPGGAGSLHNAAVLANYRENTSNGTFSYFAAEIDWDGHYSGYKLLRLAKFTGTSWVHLFAVAVPELNIDDVYDLTLDVYPQPADADGAWLVARLVGVTEPSLDVSIGPLAVSNYGPADGLFGLGTNRAITRYYNFQVDNLTAPPS